MTYALCDDCAHGVANDDWDEADEALDTIQATIEAIGGLTHIGTDEPHDGGYFTCYTCNDVAMGPPTIFEGER